jgi:hypothetical protein
MLVKIDAAVPSLAPPPINTAAHPLVTRTRRGLPHSNAWLRNPQGD